MSKEDPGGVEEVLGQLDELTTKSGEICISDVLDDFGGRSFGPFIMLPALLELSPIGGIPGVPTFLAALISLIAIQLLLGKEHIWMPGFLQNRAVESKKLHKGIAKLRGVAHWLDEHSHGRLTPMTRGVWVRIAALVVILLCMTVPPLEVLPFASSGPMLAIAAIGLALTVRDGVVMLIALALGIAAIGGSTYYYYTADKEETGGETAMAPIVIEHLSA